MTRIITQQEYTSKLKDYKKTNQFQTFLTGRTYVVLEKKLCGLALIFALFKAIAGKLFCCLSSNETNRERWAEFKNKKKIVYLEPSDISTTKIQNVSTQSQASAVNTNSSTIVNPFFRSLFKQKLPDTTINLLNNIPYEDAKCIEETLLQLEKDCHNNTDTGHNAYYDPVKGPFYFKNWNPNDMRYGVFFNFLYAKDGHSLYNRRLELPIELFGEILHLFLQHSSLNQFIEESDIAFEPPWATGKLFLTLKFDLEFFNK